MERKHKITIIMNARPCFTRPNLLFSSFKVSYFLELIRLENNLSENKLIRVGVRCEKNFNCTTLGI